MTLAVRIAGLSELPKGAALAIPVARDEEGLLVPQGLPTEVLGRAIPHELDGDWAAAQGFEGSPGQSLALRAIDAPTLVLLGIGEAALADGEVWRRAGAAAARAAGRAPALVVLLPLPSTVATQEAARAVVEGALLAAYRIAGSKTSVAPNGPRELVVVPVAMQGLSDEDRADVAEGVRRGEVIAGAVCWARDLVNRPAAQLTPSPSRPRGASPARVRRARDDRDLARGRARGRAVRRAARRRRGLARATAARSRDLRPRRGRRTVATSCSWARASPSTLAASTSRPTRG